MNQFQSFEEVLSALKRRIWIIFLVTVAGCLMSLTYALGQTKVYEATAVVQIEDARVPDQLAGAMATAENAARRVRLIEQRLMARDNLVRIMDKHDLFSDDPKLTMNERIFRMREAARIEEIVNTSPSFSPGGNAPSGLRIIARLPDPDKAADLANELMFSVIDQSRDRSIGRARDTLDFFRTEELRVSTEIEQLDQQIAEFKRANADRLPGGLTDLRAQLAGLRDAELELDRQIVIIETTSGRQRTEVRQRQIDLLNEQKLLVVERAASIQTQIESAPEVERTLKQLERRQTQLQEQYTVVTRRKAEAEMGQLLEDRQQSDRFEVLETALVPEYPVSRSRKQTAVMGGVVSVIAGIALAFIVELLNPAIRTAAQLERALGVTPVVSIPVIDTPKDRRRRGLSILAMVLASFGAVWAAFAIVGTRLPFGELLGRFLPQLGRG